MSVILYREFIEINKHKKKLQIYIQELMAAHITVDNGYHKIELTKRYRPPVLIFFFKAILYAKIFLSQKF